MTKTLFHFCLQRLDAYIKLIPGRKTVILLDNFSSHGTVDNIAKLDHIKIIFLPSRATSRVQPLDVKIIASVKAVHCVRLLYRIFTWSKQMQN